MFNFTVNPFAILFLLNTMLLITMLVFLIKKRGSSAIASWLLLCLIELIQAGLAEYFLINASSPEAVKLWYNAMFIGVILMPPTFLFFIIGYTGKEWIMQKYWLYLFITIPPLIMFYLIWKTDLIYITDAAGLTLTPWGYIGGEGTYETLLQIYNMIYYLPVFAMLAFFYYRSTSRDRKIKTMIIFFSSWLPTLGNVFFYGLLPGIFNTPQFPAVVLTSTASVLLCIYSLQKYGLSFFNPTMLASVVFQTMNEIVIVINPSYTIEYINKDAEKKLKQTKAFFIDKNLAALFPDSIQYQNIVDQLIKPLDQQAISTINEAEILTAGGKTIPVTISATKITQKNKIVGYILIMTDIAKIKEYYTALLEKGDELQRKNQILEDLHLQLELEKEKIEQKVRERTKDLRGAHAKLQASINNLNLGFAMTDKDGVIIMVNETIKDIFNLPRIENTIKIQSLQEYIKSELSLSGYIHRALLDKKSVVIKDILIGNKYINIYISPVIINNQQHSEEVIGTVMLVKDETEARMLERAKEEFFTIASHELRTPLTAIRGYASLIKQLYFAEITDDDLKKMLTDIDISSTRLINIVNDFLDTSKLEQGTINIKKEPCDISEIINTVIKEIEPIALQKKIYIKFADPNSAYTILGDKDRLKQIIINLISNAVKNTDTGGIEISLQSLPENTLKISVHDTGKGIPEENRLLLFRKFQQSGISPYGKDTGFGLGLYIAKLLIEKMGGNIQLESTQLDKGTTFSFTIPKIN